MPLASKPWRCASRDADLAHSSGFRLTAVLAIALILCAGTVVQARAADTRVQEATAFSGAPLFRYDVPVEKRAATYERVARLEAKPQKTEADFLTLGELYIEVGRFQGAIDLYTRGLAWYPESFKLLRHRGHRYLNVRSLDKAIVDLERALELLGDDNADVYQYRLSGKPFGTYEHWIWYHIGLYHYLQGDFAAAARAFERCTRTAQTEVQLFGAIDWLWNAYQQAGQPDKAAAALARVAERKVESLAHPYAMRLQLYQGLLEPQALVDLEATGAEWSGREITIAYGVANWYRFRGEAERAQQLYARILKSPIWHAWAYVITDREQATRSR